MIRLHPTLSKLPAVLLLTSVPLTGVQPAGAASPGEAGLKIAKDAYDRDKGFGNFTASQTMVLRNKQGRESRR
ncbi:MAG: hypothetical protein OXC10_20495, partial [Rhodospirillaceae bacterium]|nr:hypothetical protein [Rhodospirillaceae bacterium]